MANQPAVDLGRLLAHEPWAGRLARALVHDDDLADDIVQEARVSFWRKGPSDPQSTRAWLRTVIRNLARTEGRRQGRRRRDARSLPVDGAAPSAEELAHRLEGHRLLATLVGELREPLREAILLRYYEGMSGAAIARRLSIPAGTVRWRIKTGLHELRARLDERWEGGRERWLAVFATWRGPGPAAAIAPATPLATLSIMAGVLGTVALAALSSRGACQRAPGNGLPAAPVAAAAASGAVRGSSPPALLPGLPPAGSSDRGEPPAWALSPKFPRRIIAGRVIAGTGPVAGASLRLSSGMLTHARDLDRHTTSGPDGRFAFSPQAPTNWFLTVSAPDRVPRVLYVDLRAVEPRVKPTLEPPESLTIDLPPCRLFARGQVQDAGGGPISGARIKLTAMWNNGGVEVTADTAGRYAICVPGESRELTLVAEADGYGTVETLAYFQQSRTVDFVLEPAASVSGRAVLDGVPPRPLPGVKITLGLLPPANPNNPPILGTQPVRLETVTDERGQFHLTGLAAGRYRVQSAGIDVSSISAAPEIELSAGTHIRDLEVKLTDTVLVEGTVRRAGSPVPDVNLSFDVRGTPTVPEGHSVLHPWARSGPDGRYQVRLRPGTVVERVLGPWPRRVAPPGFTVAGANMNAVDIDLPIR
jgi:RNA polymerase sigma-70 factor (ECF subfamily)